MPAPCTVTLAGDDFTLLPQRAAFWHARSTLLLADLHLGKVETFAAHGIPLPDVMTRQLAAFTALIAATKPQRVLILGDLLHAPAGLTEPMLEAVRAWREQHTCEFAVIPGNHDRHLEKVARWWTMRVLQPRHDEGPFTFIHEPTHIPGRTVFAGHVHPVVKLRSSSDALKLWCFVIDDHDATSATITLPAFCDFTSGGTVDHRAPRRRIFAIAENTIVPLKPLQSSSSTLPKHMPAQA